MPIKFALKIVCREVYMTIASPMTLTFIQGHKCVSNIWLLFNLQYLGQYLSGTDWKGPRGSHGNGTDWNELRSSHTSEVPTGIDRGVHMKWYRLQWTAEFTHKWSTDWKELRSSHTSDTDWNRQRSLHDMKWYRLEWTAEFTHKWYILE